MRFIHIADLHLGVSPDAGSAYSKNRPGEIWDTFRKIIEICKGEKTDLLLIAGDLFHRQPLLRELKEMNSILASASDTEVVMIAGNHDYVKKNSYYRTFGWAGNVHMILSEDISCVELPKLHTAVYGSSFHTREVEEARYADAVPEKRQKYEILLAHGGDEKHIPFQSRELKRLGYDYVALGHIHKAQILEENRVAYAGSPEPTDINDTGVHGYIAGEITDKGCRIRFVPAASREYIHMDVEVDRNMTGHLLKNAIRRQIEMSGVANMYKIILTGQRDPDMIFDLTDMDPFGNIVGIADHTRPAYHFEKLMEENKDNILGQFIHSLQGYDQESVEYQALCEGVQALIETRRG
ncbi:MAG: exonuclease SbcCD subunit D [Dorea sp.]